MSDAAIREQLERLVLFPAHGQVRRIRSGEIETIGPDLPVGAHCFVGNRSTDKGRRIRAQVVSVADNGLLLSPFEAIDQLRIGDLVEPCPDAELLVAAEEFSGRAVDGLGRPIDGGDVIKAGNGPIRVMPDVLDRVSPSQPLPTGIRAIDGLLTIGKGQRIGIFAASGVGKTSLIEQLLQDARCDRTVICLVGERGREVESFWRSIRNSGAAARATLVAATSDESAPMRARSVELALCLAEQWREKGEDVLLVVDSITRLAMALREIGLVAGEPPTARAYTPNVFRELPKIVERCGSVRDAGTITAVFTVLSETDDVDDPIVEVMKSLLDGHIVLSRRLAQAGHFPAIDIGQSISRLFDRLVKPDHREAAMRCRAALADYEEARIMIESGMYKPGSDRSIDAAIAMRNSLQGFLRQTQEHSSSWNDTYKGIITVAGGGKYV